MKAPNERSQERGAYRTFSSEERRAQRDDSNPTAASARVASVVRFDS